MNPQGYREDGEYLLAAAAAGEERFHEAWEGEAAEDVDDERFSDEFGAWGWRV